MSDMKNYLIKLFRVLMFLNVSKLRDENGRHYLRAIKDVLKSCLAWVLSYIGLGFIFAGFYFTYASFTKK